MAKQTLIGGLIDSAGGAQSAGAAVLSPTGALVAAVSPQLTLTSGATTDVTGVWPMPDGTALVAGTFELPRRALVRLLPTGVVDPAFVPVIPSGGVDEAIADGSGYLIRGSFTAVGGQPRNGIARLNADGSLDAAFAPALPALATAMAKHGTGVLVGYGSGGLSAMAKLAADGTPDAGFTAHTFTATVNAIHVQPSNAVVVGGDFKTYDHTQVVGMSRIDSATAQRDPAMTDVGATGGVITKVAAAPGGKWFVIGSFTAINGTARKYIARLNSDFSLDTGFVPVSLSNIPGCIAVQSDGRVLIAGASVMVTGQRLIRLNTDGTRDTPFAPAPSATVFDIHVLADDRFLVAGTFVTISGQPRAGLARYNADGTLDAGYIPNQPTNIGGTSNSTYSQMVVDSTGRAILRGGFLNIKDITTAALYGRQYLHRVNTDGSTDATYANASSNANLIALDGSDNLWWITASAFSKRNAAGADVPLSTGLRSNFACVASDGKVYINSSGVVTRLNADGSNDSAWGSVACTAGGMFMTAGGNKPYVAGINATIGMTIGGVNAPSIVRFTSAGAADGTWTTPTTDAQWGTNTVKAIIAASTGELYVDTRSGLYTRVKKLTANGASIAWGGESVDLSGPITVDADDGVAAWNYNGTTFRTVRRFDAAGAPIAGFTGASGTESTNHTTNGNVLVFPDGSVIAAGSMDTMAGKRVNGLVRLLPSGAVDDTFTPGLSSPACRAVAQLTGGDLVAVGPFTGAGSVPAQSMALVDEDGAAADWFAPALSLVGISSTPSIDAVALHNNRVLIGGFFSRVTSRGQTKDMGSLARLLPNGDPDATFSEPYIRTNTVPGAVRAFAIDGAGRFAVTGSFNRVGPQAAATNCGSVAWLNADGSPDPISYTAPVLNATGYWVLFQPDGKTLVGGNFTTVGGVAMTGVVRYNADGSRDTGWLNPTINVSGTTRIVKRMALQPDGKVLIAGNFTSVGGSSSPGIARLNADGSRDTGFTTAVTGATECVALAADGSIFVGGNGAVAKMNADGTPAVWSNPFASGDVIYTITVEDDGSLIVSGLFNRDGYLGLARLLPSGAIDPTFPKVPVFYGTGGATVTALARGETPPIDGALLSTDRVPFITRPGHVRYVAYGGAPPYSLTVRGRAPDGLAITGLALEGTYTRRGRYVWETVLRDRKGAELVFQNDRRIRGLDLPYGALLFVTGSGTQVRRVDWEGGNDTLIASGTGGVTLAKRLPDRKILMAGTFSQFDGVNPLHKVARLNPDGSRDPTFNGLPAANTILGTISAVGQQSDGKLLVASYTEFSTFTGYIIRLNDTGSVDATFTLSGGPSPAPRIHSMHVLPDDRILLGGGGGGTDWMNPVAFRVSANGAIDTGFLNAFPGGASVTARFNTLSSGLWTSGSSLYGTPITPTNRAIWSMTVMPNGEIAVGGGFTGRRVNAATSTVSAQDFVGAEGGHATPTYNPLPASPSHYASVCVFELLAHADGTLTLIGDFSARGGVPLASGLMVVDRDGNFVDGATDTSGATAPVLNRAEPLPDGRIYATFSMLAGRAVRLFPDGAVDTSFVSPSTQVAAIIPDNGGIEGFTAAGLVGVGIAAEGGEPVPPVDGFNGSGQILFISGGSGGGGGEMEEIEDGLLLGIAPWSLPGYGLADGLRMGAEPINTLDGLAHALDTVEFGDALAVILRELLAEGFVLGGAASDNYRALMVVADALRLSGVATSQLEATNAIAAAIAFADLLAARDNQQLQDGLALGEAVTNAARLGAEMVETLLLEADAGPAVVFAALVREGVALGGGADTVLQAVEALREGVSFALHLTLDDGHYLAYSINTESKATTEYTNYPFNSFAKLGDRYFGMTPDGIRELDGPDDAGSPIAARFRMAMSNLGTGQMKRMVAAYLGYTASGDLRLKTITVDPNGVKRADHYRLLAQVASSPREARIKIGQGLRSVYWGFEVEAIDGAAFMIDVLDLQPIAVEQRIQGEGGGKR